MRASDTVRLPCLSIIVRSAVVLVVGLSTAQGRAQAPAMKLPAATVVLGRVVESDEEAGQTFIGTLLPSKRSIVGSAVDGRVEQFPVNDGQWVKKGDTLAQLLTETTEIELRAALAEEALRAAEANELKEGSLPEEVAQASATLQSAKAQLNYAKARHARADALFQRGTAITQEDMDLSFSNLTAAEQNYLAAQAAYDLVKKGPRQEKKDQAAARLLAQQEMVHQLEDRLRKFTVKAPFDGYVVNEFTEVGAWITRGDHIAEVISIDPMEIEVSVPESAIGNLQRAMTAAEEAGALLEAVVRVDAIGVEPYTGVVERIVPQADVRSRTFPVKVLLANPAEGKSNKFKAGMICHVSLPVGKRQQVLLVPKDAVVLGGKSLRVMVAETTIDPATKKEISVAKAVPVEIGAAFGDQFEISGPLAKGDSVITRGNERLMPGQPLNIVGEE
jgi:RND family efflux transporter MFP subunit